RPRAGPGAARRTRSTCPHRRGGRRLWIALSPRDGRALHDRCRKQAAHSDHEPAVWIVADRHGNLLQSDARRHRQIIATVRRSFRHRAGDYGALASGRPQDCGAASAVCRTVAICRQEDALAGRLDGAANSRHPAVARPMSAPTTRSGAVVTLAVSGIIGAYIGARGFPEWQVPVETAQVLAGVVRYPPGNPFFIY